MSRVPKRVEHADVAGRKGIGPGQHPHRDDLRRPLADAGQRAQALQRVLQRRGAVQFERAVAHRAGQRLQRADALAHDAQAADRVGVGSRERVGRREQLRRSSANGVVTGVPKRSTRRIVSVRAAFTVTCWPSTTRAAVSKPSNEPGRRRPGRGSNGMAASTASMRVGSASRSSACRSALHQRAGRPAPARRQRQFDLVALRHEAPGQPAAQQAATMRQRHRAAHALAVDRFDAIERARREEAQQRVVL